MEVNELVDSIIQRYDIESADGCLPFQKRINMLIEFTNYTLWENVLNLQMDQWVPEGSGVDKFWRDSVVVPGDVKNETGLTLVWDIQRAIPPMNTKLWVWQVTDHPLDVRTFFFDDCSEWGFVDSPNRDHVFHHLEMFSGGIGGWTAMLDMIFSLQGVQSQSIGIEVDLNTAFTYSMNHAAALIEPDDTIPFDFERNYAGHWVICDDVLSKRWLPAITKWGVDLVTISAPCPSWSNASTSAGLWKEEGQLFLHSILLCRFLRPQYIAMENVAGFCTHDHKGVIEKALRWIGYKLTWQRVWDIKELLGVSRSRWTAVAKRVHGDWSVPTLARSVFPVFPPDHSQCIFQWDDASIRPLLITQFMASVASDPKKASRRSDQLQPPSVVFQSRLYATDQYLPTFLARYGSQHEINDDFLNKHGYLGFFHRQNGLPFGARLFHPVEIAMVHGMINQLYLPNDHKLAWMIIGNCITPLHAMLPLLNVVNAIMPTHVDAAQALEKLAQVRLLPNAHVTHANRGVFFTMSDQVPSKRFLDSLLDCDSFAERLDKMHAWIPELGLMPLSQPEEHDLPPGQSVYDIAFSVASSPASDNDEHSATMPFSVVLPSALQLPEQTIKFWFSADLPACIVETPWSFAYECVFPDEDDTHACTALHLRTVPFPTDSMMPKLMVQILLDEQLTLFRLDVNTPLLAHEAIAQMAEVVYDQFGPLNIHQTTDDHTLLLSRPLKHGCNPDQVLPDILPLLAALELATTSKLWNRSQDQLELSITGDIEIRRLTATFWKLALHDESLTHLGRIVSIVHHEDSTQVCFAPARQHGVVTPIAFDVALSIAAFRVLMDCAIASHGEDSKKPFLLKWWTRPLWEGMIPQSFTAAMIIKFLQHAMMPVSGPAAHRLICQAHQVMPETAIADLPITDHRQAVLIHAVLALRGGGVGVKNQQRILQQTALASYLLEHGFELQWISKTADTLLQKHSLSKIQTITAMPTGNAKMTALLTLCRETDIAVPEPAKPSTRKEPNGLPWQRPKKKKGTDPIDPNEFTLVESFFKNQDGTPCPAIPLLRPQATGICLMGTTQAAQWLQTPEKLSADELALLVVGAKPESKLPFQELSVPCHNLDGNMVLLKCFMYQLGAKEVLYQKGDPQQVDAAKCMLMAITLYKGDFSVEQWTEATQNTFPFIRKLLQAEGLADAVLSMWGRSFRSDRAPCAPVQAQTIQVHCSIGMDKVATFLARSGFNHLFCTPKQPSGKISLDYRIIWLQCDSRQAAVCSAKVASCLGMAKGKKTLGLRFKDSDFDAAWDILCPNAPRPHQLKGELMFKAEGLPFGTTFEVMQQWAQKTGWVCQPIRNLGPRAMLLRSDRHPPEGVLMFNASPILVRHLPPKPAANASVLVGPRSSKHVKDPFHDHTVDMDPWARYTGPKPTAPAVMQPRSADGPTESRLQAQDQKLQTIEAQIQTLAKQQEAFTKHTEARFQAAEEREQKQVHQVAQTMDAIKNDLDRALQNAFQKNTAVMEERMAELKHLLGGQQKRKPEDGGDMRD